MKSLETTIQKKRFSQFLIEKYSQLSKVQFDQISQGFIKKLSEQTNIDISQIQRDSSIIQQQLIQKQQLEQKEKAIKQKLSSTSGFSFEKFKPNNQKINLCDLVPKSPNLNSTSSPKQNLPQVNVNDQKSKKMMITENTKEKKQNLIILDRVKIQNLLLKDSLYSTYRQNKLKSKFLSDLDEKNNRNVIIKRSSVDRTQNNNSNEDGTKETEKINYYQYYSNTKHIMQNFGRLNISQNTFKYLQKKSFFTQQAEENQKQEDTIIEDEIKVLDWNKNQLFTDNEILINEKITQNKIIQPKKKPFQINKLSKEQLNSPKNSSRQLSIIRSKKSTYCLQRKSTIQQSQQPKNVFEYFEIKSQFLKELMDQQNLLFSQQNSYLQIKTAQEYIETTKLTPEQKHKMFEIAKQFNQSEQIASPTPLANRQRIYSEQQSLSQIDQKRNRQQNSLNRASSRFSKQLSSNDVTKNISSVIPRVSKFSQRQDNNEQNLDTSLNSTTNIINNSNQKSMANLFFYLPKLIEIVFSVLQVKNKELYSYFLYYVFQEEKNQVTHERFLEEKLINQDFYILQQTFIQALKYLNYSNHAIDAIIERTEAQKYIVQKGLLINELGGSLQLHKGIISALQTLNTRLPLHILEMKNEIKHSFFSRILSLVCQQERNYNNIENKGDMSSLDQFQNDFKDFSQMEFYSLKEVFWCVFSLKKINENAILRFLEQLERARYKILVTLTTNYMQEDIPLYEQLYNDINWKISCDQLLNQVFFDSDNQEILPSFCHSLLQEIIYKRQSRFDLLFLIQKLKINYQQINRVGQILSQISAYRNLPLNLNSDILIKMKKIAWKAGIEEPPLIKVGGLKFLNKLMMEIDKIMHSDECFEQFIMKFPDEKKNLSLNGEQCIYSMQGGFKLLFFIMYSIFSEYDIYSIQDISAGIQVYNIGLTTPLQWKIAIEQALNNLDIDKNVAKTIIKIFSDELSTIYKGTQNETFNQVLLN